MQTKKTRKKGKGWFVNEYNKIYVCGTINGKFKRVSTGLEATTNNIKFISYKQNARDKLIELTDTKAKIKTDFVSFGLAAIKAGAKKKLANGNWSKRGRGELKQKQAEQSFFNHLVPYFKDYDLLEINAFVVEDWQNKKAKEKYSSESINFFKTLLSQIMDRAVKYEIIPVNKVKYAEKIEIVHQVKEGFTVDEARLMMEKATGMIKPWLYLAFNNGLRVGELKGLQLGDFDFNFDCLYLQRAVSGNSIIQSTQTKNHNRIIYFSKSTKKVILDWIKEENITHWLFPTKNGSFYKTSQVINRCYLQPLLKELKITGTLGMTRKTFASVADSYAMDESDIQKVMGHVVGSSTTREHYIFSNMTKEKAQKAHEQMTPINNILFDQKIEEA